MTETTLDKDSQTAQVLEEPKSAENAPLDRPAPTETQAETRGASRRGGGFFGMVLGGMIVAAAGYGVGQYWPLFAKDSAEISNLSNQINILTVEHQKAVDQIAALQQELQAAVAAQPAGTGPELAPLLDRLAALESRPAANDAALSALLSDVAALKARPVVGGDLADFQKEAEIILEQARRESQEIAAGARINAALDRLRAASETGVSFGSSLADLPDAPEILVAMAETGIPNLTALRQDFPDHSRRALQAAIEADMGDTWTERALSFLQTSTGARSLTPREGNDPDAVLSRAEAALAKGDLTATLTEVALLPAVAQEVLKPWSDRAQQRLDALAAIQTLVVDRGDP